MMSLSSTHSIRNNQLHEVVYSSHQTNAEAILALRDIRKANNPQAWLLVREVE